jgi:hypothetical protein
LTLLFTQQSSDEFIQDGKIRQLAEWIAINGMKAYWCKPLLTKLYHISKWIGLAVFVAPEESLSHVTDESTETQSEPLEKATLNLFQVLLRIIIENDAQMPDQVRCNACVLLERAFLAAKKGK